MISFRHLCLVLSLFLLGTDRSHAEPKTVRLLTIGNSFAGNAMTYFPRLADAAGHTLIYGSANLGGCTLERHWRHVTIHEASPGDKDGSPYKGQSLAELLTKEKWDFVTIQQASFISHDPATYEPYAKKLVEYIRKHSPGAQITIHQTWAYRVDDQRFTQAKEDNLPDTQEEMFDQVRKAYHDLAEQFDLAIAPCGDAMYLADTDPDWGYRPDTDFDFKTATEPRLPKQLHSLHSGYRWKKSGKDGKMSLALDGHHASQAGQYLLGCVWFEVFFGESVVGSSFVPRGIDPAYAKFLRETAHRAVAELKTTH